MPRSLFPIKAHREFDLLKLRVYSFTIKHSDLLLVGQGNKRVQFNHAKIHTYLFLIYI